MYNVFARTITGGHATIRVLRVGVDGDLKAIAVLTMAEAQLCLGKSRLTYRQDGENTDKNIEPNGAIGEIH
jgi:hypothetical protein